MLVSALIAPVALGGCATVDSSSEVAPEALLRVHLSDDASAFAYAHALTACESIEQHDMAARETKERPVAPTPTKTCIRNYPRILDEAGYVAHCSVTFDINKDGAPVDLFTDCTTEHHGTIDNPERFAARADLVFKTMANRAVEQSRFLPLSEEVPGAKRAAIVRYFNFIYIAELWQPATTSLTEDQ